MCERTYTRKITGIRLKILLDEHFGQDIATLLEHAAQIHTVRSMGFADMANGLLLSAAADSGFDALITADKNIVFQQNELNLPIAVIVIRSYGNQPEHVRPFVSSIVKLLDVDELPKRFHVLSQSD